MAYRRKSGNLRTIWRINHRPEDFSQKELEHFLKEQIIVVNGNAFDEFKFISKEDYFYLHHGNQNNCIKLLGKIIDDIPEFCSTKNGYFQRHYEILCKASKEIRRNLSYGDHLPISSKIIYE